MAEEPLAGGDVADRDVTRLSATAGRVVLNIEIVTYIVLALMLAVAALLGMGGVGLSLIDAARHVRDSQGLIVAMDQLLFVLMVVEILHTVRVSFRAGKLAAEPFLIVGLIASIRRVLVITLESSRANQVGDWTEAARGRLDASMLELGVLGGLILIMVVSIALLRRSHA